ncbi:MAG: hypothetical protein KAH04_07900, partial [Psychrilyobacter sp.]|nr:hypothetical protein [Psychrilyobacter sp.]
MKKILIVLILLITSSVAFPSGPSIYPGINQITLEEGRGKGNIIVFNHSDQLKKYKVTVSDVDNNGENSILSKSLKVYPKFLEIEGGE